MNRGDKIREALASARRRGRRWFGGRIPFGWNLAADGVRVVADKGEQAVIRRMRRWRAAGKSYGWIAARLESLGVKTKTGNVKWHAAQVRKIVLAKKH